MEDKEKSLYETISAQVEAEETEAPAPRPKLTFFIDNMKRLMEEAGPDVAVWTPNGEYITSTAKAAELKDFLLENSVEYTGAIGGQFNYIFTSTSLGVLLTVEDAISKKTISVTDPMSL